MTAYRGDGRLALTVQSDVDVSILLTPAAVVSQPMWAGAA